jgi:branched-chain amino acid transport system permease protein
MLTNVLIFSAMYILAALGFAFLFSMLGILNLAHGAVYMIGGYVGYMFIVALGFNPWVSLVITIIIIAAFGLFLERFCFRPFVGNFNRTVMICVALTVILQTTVNLMVGTKNMDIPAFMKGIIRTDVFSISYERVYTFAIGALVLIIITWLVNRTMWGQKMQAISQNKAAAFLQGINVNRISALACALGCGLAALAGCLMGAYLRLGPFLGDDMLTKALILVMLAGIGSFSGIFITGLILGIMNALLPMVLSGAVSDAIAIIIVVVLLLFRPQGFFGHEA